MRLALLLLFAVQARAFPTTSHYQVATSSDELALDSNTHWDAEASSDFITYQRPIEWDAAWWRSSQAFDLSIGSISSKQFLTYQRLKIHKDLTDDVQVRVHWLEERDFEQDRRALPLELKFRLSERWAVSVFGMPSLYKSEDDVGLSLFFAPADDWEIRASGVWGDFQRNQRNLQTDEWSEAPFGGTLSVTRFKEFMNAELHWEPRSQRSDLGAPTTDLSYESAFFEGVSGVWSWRVLYDRAYHADYAADLVRARKRSLNQFERAWSFGPHVLRTGANFFYREHRVNADQFVTREILPTLWFELPPRSRAWGTRALSLGYDATIYEMRNQQSTDQNLEHRLNVKSAMRFKKAGELALLFTFDLDRFGSGETWAGGCGQFRLEF